MRGGDASRSASSNAFTAVKLRRARPAVSGSHSRVLLPHILCCWRKQWCHRRTARIVRWVMPARLPRTQRTRRVRSGTGRIFECATLGRWAAADALQVPEPYATSVGATVAGATRATAAVACPVVWARARVIGRLVSCHCQHREHRQQQHPKRPGRATNHRHDRDLRQGSGPRGIAHRDGSFTIVPDVSLIVVMSRAMRSLTAGARIGCKADRWGMPSRVGENAVCDPITLTLDAYASRSLPPDAGEVYGAATVSAVRRICASAAATARSTSRASTASVIARCSAAASRSTDASANAR
jgi:hypothetical protein